MQPYPTSADRAEAQAQLERNKAQASYLDSLQDALLNAMRIQQEQQQALHTTIQPTPLAPPPPPPAEPADPLPLASLPLVLQPPAAAPPVADAAPANPDDEATHLLEVCTRKLAALQAQAKVTGWTADLTRRKAVLLPLMTQLLESEDVVSAPPKEQQEVPKEGRGEPLLLTGMPSSTMLHNATVPASLAAFSAPPVGLPVDSTMNTPPTSIVPPSLVHLPTATSDVLAALTAGLRGPIPPAPPHDSTLAAMPLPVVPFDVPSLAASLSAVLAAPLPLGSLSMPTPSRPHRSSSSNTSQGGSLGAISSLSKGTPAQRRGGGAARLDPDEVSLKFLEEQGLLVLSEHDAAAKLGVGVNTLKRHCRRLGLQRWPGRKLRAKARRSGEGSPRGRVSGGDPAMSGGVAEASSGPARLAAGLRQLAGAAVKMEEDAQGDEEECPVGAAAMEM